MPRIETVEYQRVFNMGNYESERITVTVPVPPVPKVASKGSTEELEREAEAAALACLEYARTFVENNSLRARRLAATDDPF